MTDRDRDIAERVARITAENARLLQRLAETEQRFHRISRGVLRLQEEERARISHDLHDGLGQSLTALKIQLELLEQEASRLHPDLLPRVVGARELADACLSETRELAHLLRPRMLDDLGLVPTLRWLVRTMQQHAEITIDFSHEGSETRLDPDVETLAFRLVQEALNNVVKHARVSSASVRVRQDPGFLRIEVKDDGVGFDAQEVLGGQDEDRGFGVRIMRDRVSFFNGRFLLRSATGAGTSIEAEIPLESPRGA